MRTTPLVAGPPERGQLMGTLLAAEVSGSTAHSLTLAVGSIVAAQITGTNTWSGLPTAATALGTALASVPLARMMGRSGRRPGLAAGYWLAVLGAGLCMAGVLAPSFPLLLAGMVLFGVGQTSNLLARYAAADIYPLARRGRAIGFIIGAAAIGSIVGPNLLGAAAELGELVGVPAAGSPFLIGLAGFSLAALLIQGLLRPDPLAIARRLHQTEARPGSTGPAAPLGAILRRPRVQIAVAALMTSQLVMIGTTSTAPVYLYDHGHQVHVIGFAVSAHLAGMYMVSPLTGWLCDRVGRLAVLLAGGLMLIGAIAFAAFAPGSDTVLVSAALFLNGVGWNFGFVAGSALLTDALAPEERTSMQGWADLATGLMGALGSAVGGVILQAWGFAILNAVGAALVLGPLAATWLRRAALRPGTSRPAPSSA
jgi:MFS family permease